MDIVETTLRRRHIWLVITSVGFAVANLLGMQTVQALLALSSDSARVWRLVADVIWVGALLAMLTSVWLDRKRLSKADLSALEDERAKSITQTAYRHGFWAMIVVSALLASARSLGLAIGTDAAPLILAIGVVTFFGSHVVGDRVNG